MNTRRILVPALALGASALLFVPLRSTQAFSKLGGFLSETQRDVRVFDNFADSTADDNAVGASQFPGATGLELAVWKGVTEWGSMLHGTGAGDPIGSNLLGSGGANFDAFWAGNTIGIGTMNGNVISAVSSCPAQTLAFTETPISDGWRIRFCDNFTWNDGPSTIGANFDIQGVVCHEYGHALGLNHSNISSATMFPSAGQGVTSLRSIASDDIAGVQCIYGVADPNKPVIVATVANPGAHTLTIHGSHFGATGNEVWLAPAGITDTAADPIVRVANVSSSSGGTVITITIPVNAGPGDVIVNTPGTGGQTLSNAFPTDLNGTFGTVPGAHPNITNVSPSTIEALIPGTAETVTLTGTDLDLATSVTLDGVLIEPSRFTHVNATTITLDMPQASALGLHNLGVTDGSVSDSFAVTIVAPTLPKYQLGNGDPLNVVDRDNGLPFILSGPVGSQQRLVSSTSNVPSSNQYISLDLGNNFSNIFLGGLFTIPAAGWLEIDVPTNSLKDPGPGGRVFYSQTFDTARPTPFKVSNLQSMTLVQ